MCMPTGKGTATAELIGGSILAPITGGLSLLPYGLNRLQQMTKVPTQAPPVDYSTQTNPQAPAPPPKDLPGYVNPGTYQPYRNFQQTPQQRPSLAIPQASPYASASTNNGLNIPQ